MVDVASLHIVVFTDAQRAPSSTAKCRLTDEKESKTKCDHTRPVHVGINCSAIASCEMGGEKRK